MPHPNPRLQRTHPSPVVLISHLIARSWHHITSHAIQIKMQSPYLIFVSFPDDPSLSRTSILPDSTRSTKIPMSLVFLHSADWQFGKPFASVRDDSKRHRLQQQRLHTVRAPWRNLAKSSDAAFMLVAGDLFDSPHVTKATVSAACAAIGSLESPGAGHSRQPRPRRPRQHLGAGVLHTRTTTTRPQPPRPAHTRTGRAR